MWGREWRVARAFPRLLPRGARPSALSRRADDPTLEIVRFILAMIDEDERAARAATSGAWRVRGDSVAVDGYCIAARTAFEDGHHIARHDPERIIAQCAAMRRTAEYLAEQSEKSDQATGVLYAMASIGFDRPDFDPAWSVTALGRARP